MAWICCVGSDPLTAPSPTGDQVTLIAIKELVWSRMCVVRLQQPHPHRRRPGPGGAAAPHPPLPAHPPYPPGRTRPSDPRAAALRRSRHTINVDAICRPTRGTRRAGIPGYRQAAHGRQSGPVLPRGPRQPAPVRPRRPDPAARLVPAAAAADMPQGQRLPDLLGVRHRPCTGSPPTPNSSSHVPPPTSSNVTAGPCPRTMSGCSTPRRARRADPTGVPPTFRIADPIRSVPEWRGMNARTAQEIHS
jgi:hypothetical protein